MKSASERFTRSAHVRLDDAEDFRFQQMVDRLKTSRSQVLRKLIRDLIGEGPDLLPQEMRVLDELTHQVAAIGHNLNQLVRGMHAGQVTATPYDEVVDGIRDRVDAVKKELLAVIDRSRDRSVGHELCAKCGKPRGRLS